MNQLISLHIISKVFERAINHLTNQAKGVYIDSLISHFQFLKPTKENATGFVVDATLIDAVALKELESSGLVELRTNKVYFLPHWMDFIPTEKYEKTELEFLGLPLSNAEQLIKELLSNTYMFEIVAMRNRINWATYEILVQLFVKEQVAVQKKYYNLNDCLKHFMFWIPVGIKQMPSSKKTNKILGE